MNDNNPDNLIALLDDDTANRIAAGEVVERPSSVVKELLENALDAEASRIEVELTEGGKRKIVVRDNGTGMSATDAILSLQRHATSKIRSAEDLFAIYTFGFRGEALPSIASVSDFRIVSKRQQDEIATEIIVRHGEIVSVEAAAAPTGTTITVENLFHTIPARLKFLKATPTELNNAADWLHRLLLAHPRTAFRLSQDGQTLLNYPGAENPLHAIAAVYGREAAQQMVPVRYDDAGIQIHGFVSKPSLTRASRTQQAIFVNRRFVRSRTIMAAFDGAYQDLMKTSRYPVAVLFAEVDSRLVDVNVHPAKTEVRFTRDSDVFQAVRRAVSNALLSGGLVPEVAVHASLPVQSALLPSQNASLPVQQPHLPPKSALSSFGANSVVLPDGIPPDFTETTDVPNSLFTSEAAVETSDYHPPSDAYIGFDGQHIGRLRVIGQSQNTYIVAESDDALLLIDQHIAHERVLYEQLMNQARDKVAQYGVVAQHLILPQTIEFDARTARIVAERAESLAQAGFVLEPFGGAAFLVRAVPALIAQKAYLTVLRDLADDLAEAVSRRHLPVAHEAALIMASCKLAVKKGDPLTMEEMIRLLGDLAQMRNPFTCPHGRPILLALPHREMDRKFHRIGTH